MTSQGFFYNILPPFITIVFISLTQRLTLSGAGGPNNGPPASCYIYYSAYLRLYHHYYCLVTYLDTMSEYESKTYDAARNMHTKH